jgi:hypothetical protein
VRFGLHPGFNSPVKHFEARHLGLACCSRKVGAPQVRAGHGVQGSKARLQFQAARLVGKTKAEVAQGHSLILHGHLLRLPEAPARMD